MADENDDLMSALDEEQSKSDDDMASEWASMIEG